MLKGNCFAAVLISFSDAFGCNPSKLGGSPRGGSGTAAARGPGMLPWERERRRGENQTPSPGLAPHRQLQASEWLGSVSQRGKTSPQAHPRFPKHRDVGGAGAPSPRESHPEEDDQGLEKHGSKPGCAASTPGDPLPAGLQLRLSPEPGVGAMLPTPCQTRCLLLPCSFLHPAAPSLLCLVLPPRFGAELRPRWRWCPPGCQGAGCQGARMLGAKVPGC